MEASGISAGALACCRGGGSHSLEPHSVGELFVLLVRDPAPRHCPVTAAPRHVHSEPQEMGTSLLPVDTFW